MSYIPNCYIFLVSCRWLYFYYLDCCFDIIRTLGWMLKRWMWGVISLDVRVENFWDATRDREISTCVSVNTISILRSRAYRTGFWGRSWMVSCSFWKLFWKNVALKMKLRNEKSLVSLWFLWHIVGACTGNWFYTFEARSEKSCKAEMFFVALHQIWQSG